MSGYKAVIIYDYKDDSELVPMYASNGKSTDIIIGVCRTKQLLEYWIWWIVIGNMVDNEKQLSSTGESLNTLLD